MVDNKKDYVKITMILPETELIIGKTIIVLPEEFRPYKDGVKCQTSET